MEFFILNNDDRYKDARYESGTDWDEIICPVNDDHHRAGERLGMLKVELKDKKKPDFLWTFLSECLVNDKVKEVLQNNNITGYDLFKAEIVNVDLPFNYRRLSVKGRGGDAAKKSGIYLKEHCKFCGYKSYAAYEHGIIVDGQQWDGSDICTVNGYSRHILITDKVRTLLVENAFSGISILPSQDLKWPDFPKP